MSSSIRRLSAVLACIALAAMALASTAGARTTVAYSNDKGGISELEFYSGKNLTVGQEKFIAANAQVNSPSAYSPDAKTVLYQDTGSGVIKWRRSAVHANGDYTRGVSYAPGNGIKVFSAGYGPRQMLLYTATGGYLGSNPWVYNGNDLVSQKPAADAVYQPRTGRIYYVRMDGTNDTFASSDEWGKGERGELRFPGGQIRTLAAVQSGGSILASVYFPGRGRTYVYECFQPETGPMQCDGQFSIPQDYVMVAGTAQWGGGTRVVYETNTKIKLYDNRSQTFHTLATDARHSWIAVSPDV
jgi:hypothetical protein